MDTNEIIEKALKLLETVDCCTMNKARGSINQKKVNNAFDLLFELKKNLGGTNE